MGDNILACALGAAAVALAGWAAGLKRRLGKAEAELVRLRPSAVEREFRVERFESLWFPVVVARHEAKEILQIRPGAPHCPACVRPLSAASQGGDWVCPGCSVRRSANLGTLSVADSVCQQALSYFEERHPGYRRVPARKG